MAGLVERAQQWMWRLPRPEFDMLLAILNLREAKVRKELDAEITRLREALDSIDMRLAYNDCDGGDCERPIRHARAVARAALTQENPDGQS